VLLTVLISAAAALSYGVSDFLGAVGARRLRVLPGTTITYLFAFGTLAVVLALVGGEWSAAALGWGAVAGVAAIAGFLAFYAALAAGPMSLASPLIAVMGSLVPVVIAIVLGERLPLLAWIAVVLALTGGLAISVTRRRAGAGIPRKTVVLSLLAGTLLGLSIVALDLAPLTAGVTPAFVEIVVGLALLGLLLAASGLSAAVRRFLSILDEEQEGPVPTTARARVASAAGGVLLGVANWLILAGLQSGSLAVVSVLVGLYPVATIVLARLVYRERLTGLQSAGVVLAIVASVLLALA
jgi:drug/metabolite transporter (DMT)-like permease